MTRETRQRLLRVLALVFVVGLTAILYINRSRVHELEALGYPGVFLISMLSNATLILPVPGVLFTSAMGAVFNPFWVAFAAGAGATIGELSGYLAGFSGQGVVQRSKWQPKVEGWMQKYGALTVFLLALVPNPVFDIAGLTAGMLKMPVLKYLFWCLLGKIGKMLIFAYAGGWLLTKIPWLQ